MTLRVFNRYVSQGHVTVFTGELLVILGSMALVARLGPPGDDLATAAGKGSIVAALCLLCLYYNDLYNLTVVRSTRGVFIRLGQAGGTARILIGLVYLALPSLAIGDGVLLPAAMTCLAGILVWRVAFNHITRLHSFGERMLIIGTDAAARTVVRQVLAQQDFPYQVVGFIDDDPARMGESVVNRRVVGTSADIAAVVAAGNVDLIVVALNDRRGRLPARELLEMKMRGVRVEDVNALYERLTGKLLVEDLRPSWLIFSDGVRASRLTRQTKRVFDVLLAIAGVVLASPLMLLTALAVWLESGAPVLYRQDRVGENGGVFTLYKFRSMRKDAETGVPIWAGAVDHRVTRVGRFIRQTRLDELPQLWNVLRGDMSFVGPRPERPFFVSQLSAQIPWYDQRHAVKPGITGWAQVRYRYAASMDDALEKLRYDLYYVKHLSLAFDLTILFDTVKVVLLSKGAR